MGVAGAERVLGERFGLAIGADASLRVVARGAMGRVWRLDTGLGATYAVKEPLWGGDDEESARAEVAFCAAATATRAVAAPASLLAVGGTYRCELPDGTAVRLFEWAEGAPVTTLDARAVAWLGHALGTLHALDLRADEPPHAWYWRCPTAAEWDDVAARVEEVREARPRLLELAATVVPDSEGPWIRCHLDVQPSNVLSHDGQFTLLDWENSGPGTPERELAAALYEWGVTDPRAALAAYREAGGPVRRLSSAAFSMVAAVAVTYVHVQARLALDPDQPAENRRFAEDQYRATLARLPTPSHLADLRAAANAAFDAF